MNQVHNDVQINVYDYMLVQQYVKILNVLQFVIRVNDNDDIPDQIERPKTKKSKFIYLFILYFYLVIIHIIVNLYQLNSLNSSQS